MIRLVDLGVFGLSFALCFGLLGAVVRVIHLITHDTTKTYWWGVISFSLLVALLIAYSNLGR